MCGVCSSAIRATAVDTAAAVLISHTVIMLARARVKGAVAHVAGFTAGVRALGVVALCCCLAVAMAVAVCVWLCVLRCVCVCVWLCVCVCGCVCVCVAMCVAVCVRACAALWGFVQVCT